jgi:hypothetical protein
MSFYPGAVFPVTGLIWADNQQVFGPTDPPGAILHRYEKAALSAAFEASFCYLAGLQRSNVLGLWTLFTLGHAELNFLTFSQSAETFFVDCAEVDKYVRALLLLDETETFFFVKPLNHASLQI